MKAVRSVFLIAALAPALCFASDKNLEICAAGGYYSGAQDRFMSGIATYVLKMKGALPLDAHCSAVWKSAYNVGELFSKTGKVANKSDAKIIKEAAEFSDKIYAAVIKNADF